MELYRQALEIQEETGADFTEAVNLVRKVGYNQALLILINAE